MSWAQAYIKVLTEGDPGTIISFRPKGNSMTPRIESGQLCTVEKVTDFDSIEIGDVLLCKVNGYHYLHLVTSIKKIKKGTKKIFLISNNHGHDNGWCAPKAIYGKLIKVEP